MKDDLLKARAIQYASLSGNSLDLTSPLGYGMDGCVWKSGKETAIKALSREDNYNREVECYRRFRDNKVTNLHGFAVPELLGFDDRLLVIEMRIVTPPYILDFAKAQIDKPMEFEEGGKEEWLAECEERFEGNWPKVRSLLFAL
jgi:hypothetical protein